MSRKKKQRKAKARHKRHTAKMKRNSDKREKVKAGRLRQYGGTVAPMGHRTYGFKKVRGGISRNNPRQVARREHKRGVREGTDVFVDMLYDGAMGLMIDGLRRNMRRADAERERRIGKANGVLEDVDYEVR